MARRKPPKHSAGLYAALRALRAKPSATAKRQVSVFPGRKVKPLPGQLSIEDELDS
jgi:hypothetical protein